MCVRDYGSVSWPLSECMPSWVLQLRVVIRQDKLREHQEQGEALPSGSGRREASAPTANEVKPQISKGKAIAADRSCT